MPNTRPNTLQTEAQNKIQDLNKTQAQVPSDVLLDVGNELRDRLANLCQLDIDAVYAYESAIAAVEETDVRKMLEQFRDDHVEHVLNLSSVLYGMDSTPPTVTRDLKGLVIEGMTKLSGLMGTFGALSAMVMNETLTNNTYEAALSWEMADGLRQLIEEHREDERRHQAEIQRMLEPYQSSRTQA